MNVQNLQQQANKAADNKAADKQQQGKASKRASYLSPNQVSTDGERRAADARKHAAELDDEAVKHMHVDDDGQQAKQAEETKEKNKIERIDWDEERKKRGKKREDEEEPEDDKAEDAAKAMGFTEGHGRYFEDAPEDKMGDLSLSDPNEMKRQLGPSVRFAQHAMMLASERMREGMPRTEAVQFLSSLYLGVSDRAYAQKALREFGPATGVLDLYPLELMKHLLENVPSFVPKVSTGSFFAKPPKAGYKTKTGEPITLTYDPLLRIRGFAIEGGKDPGYLFEPVDPPGTYELTFHNPGTFSCMVSALAKTGAVSIEAFEVVVKKGKQTEDSDTLRRAKASLADEGEAGAEPAAKPKEKKKDDLKFTIPRRI